MTQLRWVALFAAAALVAIVGLAVAAWPWTGSASPTRSDLEDVLNLSEQAPEMVAVYRHIEGHRAMAQRIPCYCGCGKALNHQSLFDCFVISPGRYSDHASGCMVCTNEAADVRRLAEEGQGVRAIRVWIDNEYAKYGAGTRTP